MLGLWSKQFLQSRGKGRKYIIFVDDEEGFKVNAKNSYMLVTEDFRNFVVKNVPNNRPFVGAVKVKGEFRVLTRTWAADQSGRVNWYDAEVFHLDDNCDLNSLAVINIRDDNHGLYYVPLLGKSVSNGDVILAGQYDRTSGDTARSYDFIQWEYVFPRTGVADFGAQPDFKDGYFYAASTKNGNGIKRSRDTVNWETFPNTDFHNSAYPVDFAHCDSFFVLTLGTLGSDNYDTASYCKVSSTGTDWVSLEYPERILGVCVAGKDFILVQGLNASGTYKCFKITNPSSIQSVNFIFDGTEAGGWPQAFSIDDGERLICCKDKIVYESSDGINFTSIGTIPVNIVNFRGILEV